MNDTPNAAGRITCEKCAGAGMVRCRACVGYVKHGHRCHVCAGQGLVRCSWCEGTGDVDPDDYQEARQAQEDKANG